MPMNPASNALARAFRGEHGLGSLIFAQLVNSGVIAAHGNPIDLRPRASPLGWPAQPSTSDAPSLPGTAPQYPRYLLNLSTGFGNHVQGQQQPYRYSTVSEDADTGSFDRTGESTGNFGSAEVWRCFGRSRDEEPPVSAPSCSFDTGIGSGFLSPCQHQHHHHHHHGHDDRRTLRLLQTLRTPVTRKATSQQLSISTWRLPHATRGLHTGAGLANEAGSFRRALPRDEGLGAPLEVFDRTLKILHRDRSSRLLDSGDPLLGAVTERLLDRLDDCRRTFPTAVVLGGAALPVLHQLAGGRAGIERVVVVDSSQDMLDRVKREEEESRRQPGAKPWPRVLCVRGDEEHLPLRPNSVNLIISCLGLHWANDLPGAMAQCRMALVPDGLFLAALLGGDTLQELRISCALAQMERQGGVSAVVSPLAQVRDAGNLLTRADLRLPTVDVDRFTLGYPSPLELVQHLRALGESNAANQRRRTLSRDAALAAAAVYQSMFGGEDGSVSATYEVIFTTGWAPAANQPKAARRGSATVSFQELADGLVKEGSAVGGTADGEVLVGTPTAAPQSTDAAQPCRRNEQTKP